jgi:hypothetical protein
MMTRAITAGVFVLALSAHLTWTARPVRAQGRETVWRGRTAWGDPDLHGEWTSEGSTACPSSVPRSSAPGRS